jgi:hypothetical protein
MSLNLKSIFRCMMEDGYYPSFEQNHIQFGVDDNIGVVEYEDDVLSVRLFFSIDEEAYGLFLEASNLTMIETYAVKPAVLDDMKNIMFSCEFPCDTVKVFRKFFPRAITYLNEALSSHKAAMRRLVLAGELTAKTIPATDDLVTGTRKILS